MHKMSLVGMCMRSKRNATWTQASNHARARARSLSLSLTHTHTHTQDHLAQMQELLGRMPKQIALGGHYSLELFNRKGELRNIRRLKFWGVC